MAIKPSNLYAYYVENHKAIKVGFGDSTKQRVKDYSKQYELKIDEKSIRTWEIPVSGLAQTIEAECHRVLVEAGLQRLAISVNGQEAQELFELGNTSYDEAVLLVAGTIDETIGNILSRLGGNSATNKENLRKKSEEARIRKEAISASKKAEFEAQVNECANYIKSIWNIKFQPVVDLLNKTRAINSKFEFSESSWKVLFSGATSPVLRMYQWSLYPSIRDLTEDIFRAMRVAKAANIALNKKYENYKVIKAAEERLKLSVWSPGGWDLNFVNSPYYKDDWAIVEVRLIVQSATYCFGGDEAIELIKKDSNLQRVVKLASSAMPPELVDYDWK